MTTVFRLRHPTMGALSLLVLLAAATAGEMPPPSPANAYEVQIPTATDPAQEKKTWTSPKTGAPRKSSPPKEEPVRTAVSSSDTMLAAIESLKTWVITIGRDRAIRRWLVRGDEILVATRGQDFFRRHFDDTSWTPTGISLVPSKYPDNGPSLSDSMEILHAFSGYLRRLRLERDAQGNLSPRMISETELPGTENPSVMGFLGPDLGLIRSADQGHTFFTRDGGRIWNQVGENRPDWHRINVLDTDSLAFLAGDSGAMARFDFRIGKLQRLKAPSQASLVALHFTTAAHGVVADSAGFLHTTFDSGATWTTSRPDTARDFKINDVTFADADHGFACGTDGAAFETFDGGVSWQRISRTEAVRQGTYRRLPPPLFYLLIALAIWIVWPAFKRQKPRILHRGIGENLSSDKPLENASEDKLGLAVQANALTGFLMNPATKPPMTFAVLGEWGKGKSSFLRIAQKGLDKNGYVTVWFNAWHHQSEESLLAALLDNIRRSELLRFHTLDGFLFRLRLSWRRIVPHLPRVLIAVALSILLCVAMMELWDKFPMARAFLNKPFEDPSGNPPAWFGFAKFLMGGSPWLLAAIALWNALRSVMVTFRTKPAELLASLSDSASIKDLSNKVGFRETFRSEFAEVAGALAEKPMVIFIDDLDRCRPQAVMATLEAINFLVTCGPCYFVIAMDKEQVSRAIIKQDEAFIERFREENRSDKAYAQHYLEKLIQVELAVPHADGKSFAALLKGSAPPATPPKRDWSWIRRYIPLHLCSGFAFVCLVFLFPKLSDRVFSTHSVITATASTRPANGDSVSVGPKDASPDTISKPRSVLASEPPESFPARIPSQPAFDAGKTDKFWSWMVPVSVVYLFLGFLVVAYFVWKDRKARDEFVDSDSFSQALTDWGELVHLAARTPRGAKTYINRLRYFATLRREWKLQWDAVQSLSTHPLPLPPLPEDEDLVALSCLELSLRTLLDQPYELGPEPLHMLIAWLEHPDQDKAGIANQVKGFLAAKSNWQTLLDGFALLGAQIDNK